MKILKAFGTAAFILAYSFAADAVVKKPFDIECLKIAFAKIYQADLIPGPVMTQPHPDRLEVRPATPLELKYDWARGISNVRPTYRIDVRFENGEVEQVITTHAIREVLDDELSKTDLSIAYYNGDHARAEYFRLQNEDRLVAADLGRRARENADLAHDRRRISIDYKSNGEMETIIIKQGADVDFVPLGDPSLQSVADPKPYVDAARKGGFVRTDRSFQQQKAYLSPLFEMRDVEEVHQKLAGSKIADLGTGDGSAVRELRVLGVDAVGVDVALSRRQAREPEAFVAAESEATGLASNAHDYVFSFFSQFYYYFTDQALPLLDQAKKEEIVRTLREIRRILKRQGKAILYPIDNKAELQKVLKNVRGLAVIDTPADYRGMIIKRLY